MRRIAAVMLMCLLFCGCTKTESSVQRAVEFRAALVQAGGCRYQAEICADFGGTVECFTVRCDSRADGATELVIESPESLAGIAATVTDKGGKITYDGMAVDFGLLADDTLAPAAAPALLVSCWSSEYITCGGTEGEYYRASYEKGFDESAVKIDTWFENHLPIYAEVCYNNTGILRFTITEFEFY